MPKNYYHTDAISDTAVAYIKSFAKASAPFFIYVAETAPHWPLMALPEDIAQYKDTYKVGWDAIRKARYQKMVKLGLIDPAKTKLPERWHNDLTWEDNPDKAWDARAMAVHAAMIDRMDQGIGRMIKALRETGQLENTLILFLSDNGASPENVPPTDPDSTAPAKPATDENRVRHEKTSPARCRNHLCLHRATLGQCGQHALSDTGKPSRTKAGCIRRWWRFGPKESPPKKGSFSRQVGHVMDFMKTFVELAGATYPASTRAMPLRPTTGVSLAPSFRANRLVTKPCSTSISVPVPPVRATGNWCRRAATDLALVQSGHR